jgi:hypothetical protein
LYTTLVNYTKQMLASWKAFIFPFNTDLTHVLKKYVGYATGHNSFTSQYLLNMYIYCSFCKLYIINV